MPRGLSYDHEEVPLSGRLAEFRTALQDEIDAARGTNLAQQSL
jgi:hypothetical protein